MVKSEVMNGGREWEGAQGEKNGEAEELRMGKENERNENKTKKL